MLGTPALISNLQVRSLSAMLHPSEETLVRFLLVAAGKSFGVSCSWAKNARFERRVAILLHTWRLVHSPLGV